MHIMPITDGHTVKNNDLEATQARLKRQCVLTQAVLDMSFIC